ncbi:MAG: class I SAM-dependent methyltransferase [Bdellovibrionales bacterium]|nr:class I SAM-dependent methyltransferase [Bdellovibrionales bacterium]
MLTFIEVAIPGIPYWDICCDHGYVGIKALRSELFPEVHFVDQVPHIMDRLQLLIDEAPRPFLRPYYLHLKSGQDIECDLYGNVLVAGVGGLTIRLILEKLMQEKKLKSQRLLLSPHTDEKVLVNFVESKLFQEQYVFIKKIDIPEGKRTRPLYVFDQRDIVF